MSGMLGLSSRDRRTVGIGMFAIALLASAGKGAPIAFQWQRAQVDSARAVVTRIVMQRRAAALVPTLRDSLVARRSRAAVLDTVLIGASSPLAAAGALAAALEDLADSADVKVTAVQIRADTNAHAGLSRVGARLIALGDVRGFADLIRAIETDRRAMSVRDLAVAQPDPVGSNAKAEMLRIDLGVEALVRIVPHDAR